MQKILYRNRPIVWLEFGDGTQSDSKTLNDVHLLFPYPIKIKRFAKKRSLFLNNIELIDHTSNTLVGADYVILPS
jgi:hypothetical protein